jgi:hypothetical protein
MVDLLLKDPVLLSFREFNCLCLVPGVMMLLKHGINGSSKIYMVSYYV